MTPLILANDQETRHFGKRLAALLPSKALIYLNGPLGAGKTTLVGAILRARGHLGNTKSPTYTLVEPYSIDGQQFYHFDLYRLGDPEELEYIGIRDYLDEAAICFIEWPEKGAGIIPEPDLVVNLDYQGEARRITLQAGKADWVKALIAEFNE